MLRSFDLAVLAHRKELKLLALKKYQQRLSQAECPSFLVVYRKFPSRNQQQTTSNRPGDL